MLGRKDYTPEELEHARSAVDQQLAFRTCQVVERELMVHLDRATEVGREWIRLTGESAAPCLHGRRPLMPVSGRSPFPGRH